MDADVIVHVPKLKTHEKVGITCALKGVVGSKECLAHYRAGGPATVATNIPAMEPDVGGRARCISVRTPGKTEV